MEDYFQASGRGGRSGDSAHSIVYWKPTDCPLRKKPSNLHHREVNDVRHYLENSLRCRRELLLKYFDPSNAKPGDEPLTCYDVCATMFLKSVEELSMDCVRVLSRNFDLGGKIWATSPSHAHL